MTRVAGTDYDSSTARIHDSPGPRWFPPDAPVGVVHGDASMYVGGVRALLLQSLHPLAMAGVAQHSDYRHDTWGRLARTATYIAAVTYASIPDAEQAVAVVRAVHRHIRGTAPDGRRYAADDPHLLAWVHAAEIDSFLTAHDLFGRSPLTAAERDTYVTQAGHAARLLGADPVPQTAAELAELIESFRPELAATEASRDVARFLLHEPPVPRALRPAYSLLGRAAVGSLPGWSREPLGVPTRPRSDRGFARAAGRAATATLRWVLATPGSG